MFLPTKALNKTISSDIFHVQKREELLAVQETNGTWVNTMSFAPRRKKSRKTANKLAAMRYALLKTENFHFALSIPLWYMLSSKRLSIKNHVRVISRSCPCPGRAQRKNVIL